MQPKHLTSGYPEKQPQREHQKRHSSTVLDQQMTSERICGVRHRHELGQPEAVVFPTRTSSAVSLWPVFARSWYVPDHGQCYSPTCHRPQAGPASSVATTPDDRDRRSCSFARPPDRARRDTCSSTALSGPRGWPGDGVGRWAPTWMTSRPPCTSTGRRRTVSGAIYAPAISSVGGCPTRGMPRPSGMKRASSARLAGFNGRLRADGPKPLRASPLGSGADGSTPSCPLAPRPRRPRQRTHG